MFNLDEYKFKGYSLNCFLERVCLFIYFEHCLHITVSSSLSLSLSE